jgi:hypothetical protein
LNCYRGAEIFDGATGVQSPRKSAFMFYVDRQDCGLPHVELDPLPSGIDLTTNYAAQVTAAPNGGQFQAIQQQIAREHSIA